jgi:hypothetical protein
MDTSGWTLYRPTKKSNCLTVDTSHIFALTGGRDFPSQKESMVQGALCTINLSQTFLSTTAMASVTKPQIFLAPSSFRILDESSPSYVCAALTNIPYLLKLRVA